MWGASIPLALENIALPSCQSRAFVSWAGSEVGEALDILEGPNEDSARSLSRVKVLVRET